MKNRPLCRVCLFLFVLMCVGICLGKEKVVAQLRPSPAETHLREGAKVTVTGELYKRETKDKYQILYLKNNSVKYQQQSLHESKIILYDESKKEVGIGQSIRARGEVSFFENARNPGNFDRKLYYQREDIHACIWGNEVTITDFRVRQAAQRLSEFREQWRKVIFHAMPEKEGGVLAAMLLGEKGGMDKELKELYQANGIGHILAISGLHLSFIGIGLYQLLRKLTGSYMAGGIGGIAFLVLYVCMIGVTVSVFRAFVMFLFRVGADMTGRHYDSPTALSFAAVLVLLWRPLSVYDGGFWLSFAAVAGVILILPVLKGFPLPGIWAGLGINLAIFPVILYYFYEFPLYSTVLNFLVVPLMSVVLFCGMVGSGLYALLGGVFLLPGQCFLQVCTVILNIYEKSCEFASILPGARVVTGKPSFWQIIVYYGFLCAGLIIMRQYQTRKYQKKQKDSGGKPKKRRISRALACFLLSFFFLLFPFGERGRLFIAVLDVGQGDSVFLRGADGITCLIDGGSSDTKNVEKYRIEPFLKYQGVGRIDYVFLSHGDEDHINGVQKMLERQKFGVKIGTLVLPKETVWDEKLQKAAGLAAEAGTKVAVIEAGQCVQEGKLAVTCIQPKSSYEGEPGNAASMVLAVTYGAFDMLLTGDVEEEGEEELGRILQEQYQGVYWEILKVAHHGSKNSSSEPFLAETRGKYAVISAGRENRYGHPHEETLRRLEEAGYEIHTTQEEGALLFEVTEGEMKQLN